LEPQEVDMGTSGNTWSIILAGGEGTRLHELTTGDGDRPIPKQYCNIRGGPSLIRRALERARTVAGLEHTMVVVSDDHREWWSAELGDLPDDNIVVQPCNRGTACGVLLPLIQILGRDSNATVVVLPSDHVLSNEEPLIQSIRTAVDHARIEPYRLTLLGVEPERPDTSLGWIAPRPGLLEPVQAVSQFVEKPSQEEAEELVRDGALWNSFIFAMRAEALFDLFQWTMPWLTRMFDLAIMDGHGEHPSETVSALYDRLPTVDFSRAVLQEAGAHMRVVAVPPCGWTDVGTPEGIARCTASCVHHEEWDGVWGDCPDAALDLAEALRSHLERSEMEEL
jgi:mannose-1-phosphate guanylyltransferase